MKLHSLHDVLVDSLRDLYNAEKQIIRALPRMAKAASSEQLRSAFEDHLEATQNHAHRLEQVFQELDLPVRGKSCAGMHGIIEEGKEVIDEAKGSDPDAIDAALIAAAQKVEHYEICGYGSARTYAQTLGLNRIADLLQETLDEESRTDKLLSELAESQVNPTAVHAGESEVNRERGNGARSRRGAGSSRNRR